MGEDAEVLSPAGFREETGKLLFRMSAYYQDDKIQRHQDKTGFYPDVCLKGLTCSLYNKYNFGKFIFQESCL